MHKSVVFVQGRFFKGRKIRFLCNCISKIYMEKFNCPLIPFSLPFPSQLSDTALGQTGQEETTSGKKSGKVIPVPQEEEER